MDPPSLMEVCYEFAWINGGSFGKFFILGFVLSSLPHIRPHRLALLPKNAKAHCILTGIVFGGARTWYLLHENHKRALREINPMDSVPDPYAALTRRIDYTAGHYPATNESFE